MNRRAFLKTATAGTAFFVAPSAWSADSGQPSSQDENLPGDLQHRIEQHRKRDAVVAVRGPDGQPVANASVKIEQTRHDFLFGCNFFGFGRFYTVLFAHPAVQAITWWDFSDHGAWQGAAAGLLRKDMSPKPVYERLEGLIKGEWWTKTAGRTNARGEYAARVFHGSHRVQVELPDGRTVSRETLWNRGAETRLVITV
jgi:hypothetical protein